jgi:hypothetical protein
LGGAEFDLLEDVLDRLRSLLGGCVGQQHVVNDRKKAGRLIEPSARIPETAAGVLKLQRNLCGLPSPLLGLLGVDSSRRFSFSSIEPTP